MTSPSDIKRELEDLSDGVLGDLDPGDRAALAVELAAAGEFEQAEAVKEAAPMKTYRARDLSFSDRLTDHVVMALYAMWELEPGVWKFFYEKTQGTLQEANYDRFPDEEWTEEPSPANGFHEQTAKDAAAEFLGNYLAWARYAEEDVGVDVETFLSHPFGDGAAGHVSTISFTATLAHGGLYEDSDLPGWADGGTVTVDGEELTVEEHAERKYALLSRGEL